MRELAVDLCSDFLERTHACRLVLDDARSDQRVVADVHHFGVALVLDDVLRKYPLQQLRIVEQLEIGSGAANPPALLNGKLERVGCRLEAVALLEDQVVELLSEIGEALARFLPPQIRLDLFLHVVEAATLDGGHADDVKAE